MIPEIRFVADAMLQSLAKWIRLLGYDCAAGDLFHGRALLEKAVAENRWVLTRNRRLPEEMPHILLARAEIHLVASEQLPGQLRELVDRFALDPVAFRFTRCLVCNEPLFPTTKSQVADLLPPSVLETKDRFWRCHSCGRVFWQGSHVHRSIQQLDYWLKPP
ncbi:MAG: Mut7-C RNAse domain-containing protein [Verrucomicrobia bacterium]|nr:Mut7-C RNAse domain-containing protein [Verrucomicrobiota bacterium]